MKTTTYQQRLRKYEDYKHEFIRKGLFGAGLEQALQSVAKRLKI